MEPVSKYFDLTSPGVSDLFAGCAQVWDAVGQIPAIVDRLLGGQRYVKGTVMPGAFVGDGPVYIAPSAVLEPGSYVVGPAFVGEGVRLRHGSYVRENCVFLEGSLLGHSGEAKNAIFLPGARAPHFAYVGDSVLGHRVNLGAGTKVSNATITRTKRSTIRLTTPEGEVDTGLRKMGAVVGDDVEVGCNVVLNPGAIIGMRALIYPGLSVPKGIHAGDTVMKLRQKIEIAVRQ